MPRSNRIHFQHAIYHLMLRGNNKQKIFHDNEDKALFLRLMKNCISRFNCSIHLYCLMDNHVHATIEVDHIPLNKIVQSIAATYANIFNQRHKRTGHVFQGRYRAKLVYNDEYFKELAFYIHMNPVKAGIVKNIDEYPWSSHLQYMQIDESNWVTTDYISNILSEGSADDSAYTDFIQYKSSSNEQAQHCDFTLNGDLTIKNSINEKTQLSEYLVLENVNLNKLAIVICDHFDISTKQLSSQSCVAEVSTARAVFTYFAHYHAKHTLTDIGFFFDASTKHVKQSPEET